VRNPKGKKLFERPSHKWEDNIIKDYQEVGWSMGWIDLAQDRDM
jgi:hypothetical protein